MGGEVRGKYAPLTQIEYKDMFSIIGARGCTVPGCPQKGMANHFWVLSIWKTLKIPHRSKLMAHNHDDRTAWLVRLAHLHLHDEGWLGGRVNNTLSLIHPFLSDVGRQTALLSTWMGDHQELRGISMYVAGKEPCSKTWEPLSVTVNNAGLYRPRIWFRNTGTLCFDIQWCLA